MPGINIGEFFCRFGFRILHSNFNIHTAMTSFKSKMFNFMMRNRHLLQGKLRREKFFMHSSIPAFRELCEKSARKYSRIPQNITIREQFIAGMKAEWITPENAPAEKLILYVHGGGYVSGSCSDHRGFVSAFAKNCGFTTLIFDYRLAPEYPFPAALEDAVTIYQWVISNGFKSENVLIAGESAGGGLCLATLLGLKERSISLPVAAVAISPWTDLTCSSLSYQTKHKVSVAPQNSWIVFAKHYIGKDLANNPLISPLFGDLHGLPSIFINSGEDDELFDDGEKFVQKACEAGVNATFRKGVGMVHCYPLLAPMFPEAVEAMNEIVAFVKEKLG